MNPKNRTFRFSFGPWNLSEGGDLWFPRISSILNRLMLARFRW